MDSPLAPIPPALQSSYTKLRLTLGIGMVLAGIGIAYTFLFPTLTANFDFRNPKSSRNQVFDPRSDTGTPRTNGKLERDGRMIANASPLGDFSHLAITATLEKNSLSPDLIEVALARNYRAFLLPIGDKITDFPAADLYQVGDNYYALRDDTLYPFVSETAFLSRYPAEAAQQESAEWRTRYPSSPDFIGFRVGSLLSFADGVYVVTSETDIRPVGSAEIFLALGYSFDDVVPVDEESLGIYKRGRIMLMGAVHPDGTLFREQQSETLYLIEDGQRRPIEAGRYRDFLLAHNHPIVAREPDAGRVTRCTATARLFPRTLDCALSLTPLDGAIGPDYEITLSGNNVDIDVTTLSLAFETRLDADNARALLAKMKQRFLARFGLSQ